MFKVIRRSSEFPHPYLENGAKGTEIWNSGRVVIHIGFTLIIDPVVFKVILGSYVALVACKSKTAGHRVKWAEIWNQEH